MKIGVLCIGDELLKGAVINTNLAYMGQKLLELGIIPELSLEVPDRPEDVVRGLDYVMSRADFIITSGGLGPTADDLTKPSIAKHLGYPLELCEEAAEAIKARWMNLKRGTLPFHFLNQAYVPKGGADERIRHRPRNLYRDKRTGPFPRQEDRHAAGTAFRASSDV